MQETEAAAQETPPRGLGTNYLKLWSASAISNLGDGVRLTAMPLLAATLTRDPALVAGVSLASGLPWLLFALIGGAIADRVDRRGLMWSVQVVRMALMGLLSVAILVGWRDRSLLYLLYAVAFLLGTAETLFDNAAQAIMPSVVSRDQLEKANGRLYAAEMVTNQFAGPPLGGFLFAAAFAAPFILDAASFAIAAVLIVLMNGAFRPARAEAQKRPTLRTDIAEGLRWLWRHKLLRTLAAMVGVFNLTFTATFSIFVLYALEILDLGPTGFGVVLAAGSGGSVVGSLFASRVARRIGTGPSLFLSVSVSGVAALITGLTSSAIVVGAMGFLVGVGVVLWNVITVSLRQSIVPDHLLGRVNSAYRLLAWGTMPLGAAVGGLMGRTFGLRSPWFLAAGALMTMAVIALPVVNSKSIEAARAESA
jgi:MFS family permease